MVAYAARRADAATAADVVSETFAVAWRRVADLPDADGQRAWLITIARNVLANARRSERRRKRLVDRVSRQLERTIHGLVVESGAFDDVLDDSLVAALDDLGAEDRELLTLLAWDGLTRNEISQVLGCSDEALRTRIHRARLRFRSALERHRPRPDVSAPEGNSADHSPGVVVDHDTRVHTTSDDPTAWNSHSREVTATTRSPRNV